MRLLTILPVLFATLTGASAEAPKYDGSVPGDILLREGSLICTNVFAAKEGDDLWSAGVRSGLPRGCIFSAKDIIGRKVDEVGSMTKFIYDGAPLWTTDRFVRRIYQEKERERRAFEEREKQAAHDRDRQAAEERARRSQQSAPPVGVSTAPVLSRAPGRISQPSPMPEIEITAQTRACSSEAGRCMTIEAGGTYVYAGQENVGGKVYVIGAFMRGQGGVTYWRFPKERTRPHNPYSE